MREKLISARFRHLNETLYTKPSEEAYQLFQDSPEMFDEYHEGFRRQVKVWPENPVDSFLQDIRSRGKVRQPGKGRPGAPPTPLAKMPLPRTQQECTIADLGCGDARLAEALQADGKKLRVNVKSFDLQSPSPLVTKADIANLPLADGSVNVAVFCLALMGTNWVDFIEEAYRILHWKGELWVAEIKSRFGPIRNKNAPVVHSVGNRKRRPRARRARARVMTMPTTTRIWLSRWTVRMTAAGRLMFRHSSRFSSRAVSSFRGTARLLTYPTRCLSRCTSSRVHRRQRARV
ncbi:25S rRNA (adenine645-N1)-methyltransferase [Fusarium falciforme]|nr:25S rRNA (adenine645-N1)-methyltransferase [Fusarium falciforme]